MSVGPIDAGMPRVSMLQPHDSFEVSGGELAPPAGAFDGPGEIQKPGFSDLLVQAVGQAAELGHVAGDNSAAFARGTLDDLHGTMIASKEAEISVKLVGTIRSKLLESFHELWRTNV